LPKIGPDDGASIGVDVVISADAITLGAHEIGAPRLEAHFDGGAPTAVDLTGGLYDGTIDFTLRSEGSDRKKLNGAATLRNADLARALPALVGVDAIRGRCDLRVAFSAPARWGSDIWSGLSGSIELKGGDGAIVGLDLPLMRDVLRSNDPRADVISLLGAGLGGGKTPFSMLDGTAHMQNGVVVIDKLRIATAVGEAAGGGGADLGQLTIDGWLALPIAGQDAPPIRLQIGGRFDDPRIALDIAQLQSYLARRNADPPGQAQGGASQ
jgi:AsmA protein